MDPQREDKKNQKDRNKVPEQPRPYENVAEKSSKDRKTTKPLLPKSQSLDKNPLEGQIKSLKKKQLAGKMELLQKRPSEGKMESLKRKPTGSPAMKKPIEFINLTANDDTPSSEKPSCSKNLIPVKMETKKSRQSPDVDDGESSEDDDILLIRVDEDTSRLTGPIPHFNANAFSYPE